MAVLRPGPTAGQFPKRSACLPVGPKRQEGGSALTRRRKRSGRPPAAARTFPPAAPGVAILLAERSTLRAVLRMSGVSDSDLDDAVQQCVVGAWLAIRASRFRPDPAVPLVGALRRWLVSIAIRSASHFRERAHRYREIPSGCARFVGLGIASASSSAAAPEAHVRAKETLRALSRLRPERREVLALTGLGWRQQEIARDLAIPEGTVATRLRLARGDLARLLRGPRGCDGGNA
jgi:RNA polymerase sigma-70 factor, ECF subfamily